MLLDSNIVIYASKPEHSALRAFIAEHDPAVSVVTRIEVLGFHALGSDERLLLERFFQAADVLPLTDSIAQIAILLRQQRKMSLGDSIIAATALAHQRVLVTRNVSDFRWVDGLQLTDPFSART
ncbi:type II toxin-antitoxin system VapC family toxin [Longimicrobium terrae]|uniref:PIN domain-containing protein n=1 Tax=Longimicrobium terrae TaxID=1639882 RepID=A0A841H0H5_9BACT|nr:type II toxin-antitoxin system VapC family toxin [Longimicrobium terrae]MBB4637231.1 hypothetical protein [Longimicrobium terrae]MBB6071507.1 hypothetical protein [Longimicrobium terrae]NNC30070.1 type II toxin-antitoxin system VapC family toxin [Longimicrobium terrae]